jgi:hypothetical protein
LASKTKLKPKTRPGTFAPGNIAARGNVGPLKRNNRRYVTLALVAELDRVERGSDVTNLVRVARAMVKRAIAGDVAAGRFLADRIEGLPHASVDVRVNKLNARALAEEMVTEGTSPAEMSRLYQRSLRADDDEGDDETTH